MIPRTQKKPIMTILSSIVLLFVFQSLDVNAQQTDKIKTDAIKSIQTVVPSGTFKTDGKIIVKTSAPYSISKCYLYSTMPTNGGEPIAVVESPIKVFTFDNLKTGDYYIYVVDEEDRLTGRKVVLSK